MRTPNHPTLLRRMIDRRLKQLSPRSPVLTAALSFYRHRCGRRACRCHHGGPLHTGQHLTIKENGKTRSVYVPQYLLPEVRAGIAEHRRPQQLLQEIQQLTLALVHNHSRHQRRQRGRP